MGLKNIPAIISPDLLHALSSMGHGDYIDIHFPTSSTCRNGAKELRADGHSILALLEAILTLLPLDTYVDAPVAVMQTVKSDKDAGLVRTPLWDQFETILQKSDNKVKIEEIERFAFYDKAKKAFAIVATGETAKYGNVVLTKGLVKY